MKLKQAHEVSFPNPHHVAHVPHDSDNKTVAAKKMAAGVQYQPSAANIAKAIRHAITGQSSSLAEVQEVDLYHTLCTPDLMFGQDGSVWAELATLSTISQNPPTAPVGRKDGAAPVRDVVAGTSINTSTGQLLSLCLKWVEIKSMPSGNACDIVEFDPTCSPTFAPDEAQATAMRRWPPLTEYIHFVMTWHSYSVYISRDALDQLRSRLLTEPRNVVASCLLDAIVRSVAAITALLGPQSMNLRMSTALVQHLVRCCGKRESQALLADRHDNDEGHAFGIIVSATWLTPYVIQTRRWDMREASVPKVSATVRGRPKSTDGLALSHRRNEWTAPLSPLPPNLRSSESGELRKKAARSEMRPPQSAPSAPNGASLTSREAKDVAAQQASFLSRLVRRPMTPSTRRSRKSECSTPCDDAEKLPPAGLMKAKRPPTPQSRGKMQAYKLPEYASSTTAFHDLARIGDHTAELVKADAVGETDADIKGPRLVHCPGFLIEQSVEVCAQSADPCEQALLKPERSARHRSKILAGKANGKTPSLRTTVSDISRMTGFASVTQNSNSPVYGSMSSSPSHNESAPDISPSNASHFATIDGSSADGGIESVTTIDVLSMAVPSAYPLLKAGSQRERKDRKRSEWQALELSVSQHDSTATCTQPSSWNKVEAEQDRVSPPSEHKHSPTSTISSTYCSTLTEGCRTRPATSEESCIPGTLRRREHEPSALTALALSHGHRLGAAADTANTREDRQRSFMLYEDQRAVAPPKSPIARTAGAGNLSRASSAAHALRSKPRSNTIGTGIDGPFSPSTTVRVS